MKFFFIIITFSKFMFGRNTLMSIAKHYETGEPLPEEVYQRLVVAKTFRAGSLSLRQVVLSPTNSCCVLIGGYAAGYYSYKVYNFL
ncbi:hypothetical protein BHM03_00006873 [Ensete ventricosum]|nr:hypothetical protein BHM03_00006873 [Ensete ventricosum]